MKKTAVAEITALTNEIVIVKNETPVVSHYTISEKTWIDKSSISSLIRQHRWDLEDFWKVGFEIRTLETSRTGQKIKEFFLNEQQATLLMTYLRNNEVVREFKKKLVKAFFKLRESYQNQPKQIIRNELIQLVVQELTEKQKNDKLLKELFEASQTLKEINDKQEEEIKALKLRLDSNKMIQTNIASLWTEELLISIEDLAKRLWTTRPKMFKELRYWRYLKLDNKPYKHYLNKLFKVVDTKYLRWDQNYNYKQTMVTREWIEFFTNLFKNSIA